MTRRRWIADEATKDTAWLTGDRARRLATILRARPGQEFDIVCGEQTRRGTIVEISPQRVRFELGQEVANHAVPELRLILAIYKFDRMEWALEKCVELGVKSIQPLISARTDVHLVKASAKRVERWKRLALQASEQSRRSTLPEVKAPIRFDALRDAGGHRIVLAETEGHEALADVLLAGQIPEDDQSTTIAIGPEGGWTGEELRWFADAGWDAASLGPTILRAETAAIAAVAIATSELGR